MRKLAIPAFITALLILPAAPGAAAGQGCPTRWEEKNASPGFEEYDRDKDDKDGKVCTKQVPGKGNTGDGIVAKDNNSGNDDKPAQSQ